MEPAFRGHYRADHGFGPRDYAILGRYENIGLSTGQPHLEYARGHKSPRDRCLRCFASKSITHPTARGIHPARDDFAGMLRM
jgi:hypothetical protein